MPSERITLPRQVREYFAEIGKRGGQAGCRELRGSRFPPARANFGCRGHRVRPRGSGNRDTELRLIQLFRASQIVGWRRNSPLFGKPDFVFPRQRIAVFVDGCFWHRHDGCKFSYTPKSRLDFWLRKFAQNIARDRLVTRALRKTGWRVLRIWECDLGPRRQHRVINRVRRMLEFVPIGAKQSQKS